MDETFVTGSRTDTTDLQDKPKKKKRFWKGFKIFLFSCLALAIIGGGAGAGYLVTLIKRAPELNLNAITNMAATTKVYDAQQQYMFSLQGDGDRDLIQSLDQVSPHVVNAFIAAEDKDFRSHFGINPIALARALFQNVVGGGIVSGASTITQQTIKNAMFPEQDRTLDRKVQEMYLAVELEKQLTKDEIMITYLNWIYFGKSGVDNLYGIERSSKAIFGIPSKDLNLSQATVLAALPNNPSMFDTGENFDATLGRQEYILREMLDSQFITQQQYDEAKQYDVAGDIAAQRKKTEVKVGEFGHLNPEIETRAAEKLFETGKYDSLDSARQALFRGGYSIYTTIERDLQNTVDKVINTKEYYPPNISYTITDNKGKQIQVDDAMEQAGASLIDNKTGRILALGGGRNFELDQVNHATRPRQPGSTMKPIAVFGPALEQKLIGSGSAIDDVPTVWPDSSAPNGQWFPLNWDKRFHGLMTARTALEQSYNIPALKLFNKVTPKVGLDYVRRMGVTTLEDSDVNMAAGIGGLSHGLTVLEATSSFSTIPNAGTWRESYMIDEIKDRDGNSVYKHTEKTEQVFSPDTSYILNDMLKGVVIRGTATDVGRKFPGYAIAGKTGTTDDDKDAWFIGYTPDVTLGIWVGYNMPVELKKEQTKLPVRLWNDIMAQVMTTIPNRSKEFFPNPGGVRQVSVCKLSGKLPTELCQHEHTVVTELFRAGTEPREQCDVHVKAKYYEVGGKKYLATDSTPAYLVKEGIFIKRDKYTLPGGNKSYLPLDAALELPEGANGEAMIASSEKTPGSLQATVTTDTVSLSWKAVDGAQNYVVLRAESAAGPYQSIGETASSSYTDGGLTTGQSYSYQVVAVDADGVHSAPSAAVTVTPGRAELAVPGQVNVKQAAVGLTVNWLQVDGANSYTVYRSTEANGNFQKIASVEGSSFNDVGALPGTTFYYRVTATANGEESGASASASGTVAGGGSTGNGSGSEPLPRPSAVSVSPASTGGSLVVSWGAVDGAASYSVERSTDMANWTAVGVTSNASYTDDGLTAGQTYHYRVRAVDKDGNTSIPSKIVSETPGQ